MCCNICIDLLKVGGGGGVKLLFDFDGDLKYVIIVEIFFDIIILCVYFN